MPKLYEYFGLIVLFYYRQEFVTKWIEYFVLHKNIEAERITRRLS
jgi:hypothetical protein